MTQEQAKKWLPLIAAKAEGKCFDWKFKGKWISAGQLPIMVGGGQNSEDFRIRREPKLVPWTNETAPKQALYKFEGCSWIQSGLLYEFNSSIDFGSKILSFDKLINYNVQHSLKSIDGPWLPCGTYKEEA